VKTILLVDDDESLREAVAEVLEDEGHRVERCIDGADALAKLRAGVKPDLILLDLMMPIMDGWQFREAQLKDPRLAPIPVIVVTAAGGVLKHIDARRILRKPFAVDELFEAVNEIGRVS
jgi:CheY-like chemotaxis protein